MHLYLLNFTELQGELADELLVLKLLLLDLVSRRLLLGLGLAEDWH